MSAEALIWTLFCGAPLFFVAHLAWCAITGRATPGELRRPEAEPPTRPRDKLKLGILAVMFLLGAAQALADRPILIFAIFGLLVFALASWLFICYAVERAENRNGGG